MSNRQKAKERIASVLKDISKGKRACSKTGFSNFTNSRTKKETRLQASINQASRREKEVSIIRHWFRNGLSR